MTEKRRKAAAERFRKLLDDKKLHKRAIAEGLKLRSMALAVVFDEFGAKRASVYSWCKKWGVSTR